VTNLDEVKQQHPMEAKKTLAEQLVRQYHGDNGAEEAKADFQQRFQKRDFPDEPDAHIVLKLKDFVNPKDPSMSIVDVLMRTGLVPSKGEARRLISQHAIQVNGEKMSDINEVLKFKPEQKNHVKIGKRKFALIEIASE
jgi:tyrosyl-tRNA synthetase